MLIVIRWTCQTLLGFWWESVGRSNRTMMAGVVASLKNDIETTSIE
jgi:hypothetical protein